jgi:hypothetical protein
MAEVADDQIKQPHFKKKKGLAKRKRIARARRQMQLASRRGNR